MAGSEATLGKILGHGDWQPPGHSVIQQPYVMFLQSTITASILRPYQLMSSRYITSLQFHITASILRPCNLLLQPYITSLQSNDTASGSRSNNLRLQPIYYVLIIQHYSLSITSEQPNATASISRARNLMLQPYITNLQFKVTTFLQPKVTALSYVFAI